MNDTLTCAAVTVLISAALLPLLQWFFSFVSVCSLVLFTLSTMLCFLYLLLTLPSLCNVSFFLSVFLLISLFLLKHFYLLLPYPQFFHSAGSLLAYLLICNWWVQPRSVMQHVQFGQVSPSASLHVAEGPLIISCMRQHLLYCYLSLYNESLFALDVLEQGCL